MSYDSYRGKVSKISYIFACLRLYTTSLIFAYLKKSVNTYLVHADFTSYIIEILSIVQKYVNEGVDLSLTSIACLWFVHLSFRLNNSTNQEPSARPHCMLKRA